MGGIVNKAAFHPPTPATYQQSHPSLRIVGQRKIPCFLYFATRDKNEEECLKNHLTILFTHGNAEDIGQLDFWMNYLATELRVNILTYDYCGYGINQVHSQEYRRIPSEQNCYDDIQEVFDYLTEEKGIPPKNIVLFGRSLGSGPTVHMAYTLYKNEFNPWNFFTLCLTSRPNKVPMLNESLIAGMILQSPIASAIRVVSTLLAYSGLDIFQNIYKISTIKSPTLIIHGTSDQVVPFVHGELLFQGLSPRCRWDFLRLENAGHNDIEINFAQPYISKLKEFVEHLSKKSGLDLCSHNIHGLGLAS